MRQGTLLCQEHPPGWLPILALPWGRSRCPATLAWHTGLLLQHHPSLPGRNSHRNEFWEMLWCNPAFPHSHLL